MERKKTGKYMPGAMTSSRRKNQSLRRTRRKEEKMREKREKAK